MFLLQTLPLSAGFPLALLGCWLFGSMPAVMILWGLGPAGLTVFMWIDMCNQESDLG